MSEKSHLNLGFEETQAPFDSPSQSARVWTEGWAERELYCPACGADRLQAHPNNAPVADLLCGSCREDYELKSQKTKIGRKVLDGAWATMLERLASASNPSLFVLRYDRDRQAVSDLIVVPKHFFTADLIEKRKPLAPTARRAGWVGCNILLEKVPPSGRIQIVRDSIPADRRDVIEKWSKTAFLRDTSSGARGWLVEIMAQIEALGRADFTIDDAYGFAPALGELYPENRHVREKIRQQLQVLRDRGWLEFVGRGRYRLTP
ncbi:MAG: restriction endonuclease [Alphaproteobacteria bacterium]|nr:restriction endonuclease [Alphaproteobacteria bacterium]